MLWKARFTHPIVKRTRAALALALTLIAAFACADRATDPTLAATQRASKDINSAPIDDLWISPNRTVISGETATGYLTLVNPPAAGTPVYLSPKHPNVYVTLPDTVLIWPGGNIASFLVQTIAEPYQLGVSTYALVGSQWYIGKGFTLLASPGGGGGPPPPPPRTLSVTPDTLRFGTQAPNTNSAPQVVTVRNTSSRDVIQVWNFVTSTPLFTITDNHCHQVNLAANGGSCTISVMYSPTTSAAAQTGSLTFQSGADTTPRVTLIGTPTPWIYVTPGAIGFGSVALGNATSGRVVKITNTGTATFSVSSLTLGGTNPGDFPMYVDNCTGATLSPGVSCMAYVSFEPLALGARSAKITIAHNATGGPVVVSLSGSGVKPAGGYIP